MPGTKSGRNQNHNNKPSKHCAHGRSFTDNRAQQEHLAKLLLKKEKEKNRNDDYFRAQRDAQHRAQETARQVAAQRAEHEAEFSRASSRVVVMLEERSDGLYFTSPLMPKLGVESNLDNFFNPARPKI